MSKTSDNISRTVVRRSPTTVLLLPAFQTTATAGGVYVLLLWAFMMGTFQTTVMVRRRVHDAPVSAPGQQRVRLHVYDAHVSARGRRAVCCGFVTTAVRCDPYFPYGIYGRDLFEGFADSPTMILRDAQAVTDGSHMEWLNRPTRWLAATYVMIRWVAACRAILLARVASEDMVADIVTKAIVGAAIGVYAGTQYRLDCTTPVGNAFAVVLHTSLLLMAVYR